MNLLFQGIALDDIELHCISPSGEIQLDLVGYLSLVGRKIFALDSLLDV